MSAQDVQYSTTQSIGSKYKATIASASICTFTSSGPNATNTTYLASFLHQWRIRNICASTASVNVFLLVLAYSEFS
jgi:hypothetical protein